MELLPYAVARDYYMEVYEAIELTAFANGAVIAAAYLSNRQGYYEMKDVVAHHLQTNSEKPAAPAKPMHQQTQEKAASM